MHNEVRACTKILSKELDEMSFLKQNPSMYFTYHACCLRSTPQFASQIFPFPIVRHFEIVLRITAAYSLPDYGFWVPVPSLETTDSVPP